MTDTPAPVLILASRESGGSLLSALLGAHPGFCGAPHLNLLAFDRLWQLTKYSQIPRDSNIHGLLRFVGMQLVGEQSLQSVQAAQRWLARRSKATGPSVHAELRAMVAPRRLVDYSPLCAQNVDAMRRSLAAVPEATIIHLTRNPLSQGRAISRPVWQAVNVSLDFWNRRGRIQPSMDVFEIGEQLIDWSVTPPVFDPQFAWYRTQNAAHTLLAELPPTRVIHLHLETLLAKPAKTLTALLRQLEAPADPALVKAMLRTGVSDYSLPGPYPAPFGMDYEMLNTSVESALKGKNKPLATVDTVKALPWRGDGETLLAEVASLSRALGYPLAS